MLHALVLSPGMHPVSIPRPFRCGVYPPYSSVYGLLTSPGVFSASYQAYR